MILVKGFWRWGGERWFSTVKVKGGRLIFSPFFFFNLCTGVLGYPGMTLPGERYTTRRTGRKVLPAGTLYGGLANHIYTVVHHTVV